MADNKSKLIAAGAMLLLAVALIVSATFAWFTVSTAPEITGMTATLNTDDTLLISDTEDGTYSNWMEIDFSDFAPLQPISTADGENWFIATYYDDLSDPDTYGMLKEIDDFVWYVHSETAIYALDENGEGEIVNDSVQYGNVKLNEDNEDINEFGYEDGVYAYQDGYYVYTTVWLMTEEDNGCDVYLSTPSNIESLDEWETERGVYGTYALVNYEVEVTEGEEGEEDSYTAVMQKDAQTALRVGFQLVEYADTNTDGEISDTEAKDGVSSFIIYEPNADQRSSAGDSTDAKPTLAAAVLDEDETVITAAEEKGTLNIDNEYIKDYQINSDFSNYQDGYYIPTQPVALVEVIDEDTSESDGYAFGLVDLATLATTVDTNSTQIATTTTQLIIQTQSAWKEGKDEDSIEEAFYQYYIDALNTGWSPYVETFGMFILDYEELTNDPILYDDDGDDATTKVVVDGVYDLSYSNTAATEDTAANVAQSDNLLVASGISSTGEGVKITSLEKDTPKEVTIYIWIEGQDADCWNDIATGSFVINLELVGQ